MPAVPCALRRGKQYFQASSFRYNLVQNEGQLNDVYGVIDLEEPLTNPFSNLSHDIPSD